MPKNISKSMPVNFILSIVFILLALLLGSMLSRCMPYQQQIQQGNIITPAMMASLKPGLDKEQVAYLLGTPDIKNPWNQDEWYYVYTNKEDSKPLVEHQLKLIFDTHQKLIKIEGTYAPPSPLQYTTVTTENSK